MGWDYLLEHILRGFPKGVTLVERGVNLFRNPYILFTVNRYYDMHQGSKKLQI